MKNQQEGARIEFKHTWINNDNIEPLIFTMCDIPIKYDWLIYIVTQMGNICCHLSIMYNSQMDVDTFILYLNHTCRVSDVVLEWEDRSCTGQQE